MLPGKCEECGEATGEFFTLKKDNEFKFEVCEEDKDKLVQEGWTVSSTGMH